MLSPICVLGQGQLFVIVGIHEMELVALAVEKLHFPFVEFGFFKLVVGTVGFDQLVAGDHVAHLAAVEGLALAGFGKLKLGDNIGFPSIWTLSPLRKSEALSILLLHILVISAEYSVPVLSEKQRPCLAPKEQQRRRTTGKRRP